LFWEQGSYILQPGQYIYRDQATPAYFNLFTTVNQQWVPAGTYLMSLWVDDENAELESNEYNNYSTGSTQLPISYSVNYGARDKTANSIPAQSAFNGKKLPSDTTLARKVEITYVDGKPQLKMLDQPARSRSDQVLSAKSGFAKQAGARDRLVFPRSVRHSMPTAEDQHHEAK
jgi:hypothetical protein